MPAADAAGAALFLAAVAIRVLGGRRSGDAVPGTDVLFHLSYSESIRANRHRVPRRHPRITGPGVNSYPALMHWLVSFLPPGAVPGVERNAGLLLDLVPAAGVSWLLADRVPSLGAGGALALAGLYLLAPGLTFLDIGPRAYTLTPRVLSQALWAGAVLVLLAGDRTVGVAAAAVVVGLLALMLLTAKFALQNLVFVVPVAALLVRSPLPLALAAAAFAVAQALSLGFFARQLRGQAGHLEWYRRRHLPYLYKNPSWRPIGDAMRRRDARALGEAVLLRNPVVSGVLRHLHLFVAIAWYVERTGTGGLDWTPGPSGSRALAAAFCVAALGPWLLTSFGPFRILGEPERYLEFAFPAAWFLLWTTVPAGSRPAAITVVALWSIAMQAANVVLMRRFVADRGGPSLREVVEKTATFDAPVVLSLDVTESYAFLAAPGVRVCVYNGQQTIRGEPGEFIGWFLWRYPFVHPAHLGAIVDRCGVTHVVAKRASVGKAAQQGAPPYDLARYETVLETEEHALLQVPARP